MRSFDLWKIENKKSKQIREKRISKHPQSDSGIHETADTIRMKQGLTHPAGDVTRVSVMPRKVTVSENRGCRESVSVMPR